MRHQEAEAKRNKEEDGQRGEHLDSSTVVTLPTGACAEGTMKVTFAVKGLMATVGTGVGAALGDGDGTMHS